MARAPYRPVEETEALRPVATPVDTFVTPQAPSRDTPLQDLARSLSGLGGNLGSFVDRRDKEAEEADKIRGTAAAWKANGEGAAQGVAQGLIPAQASPAFMRGYKQVEGEIAGGQLEAKFAAAYDTWEGKTSTDPKAYDQFIGGFLKDNIKTDDPDVLRGLIPKVHQVAANYLQKHIGDTSKATMQGYTTALSAKGEQVIDDANSIGLATKSGTDYPGVFGRLEAIREEGKKVGANQEQVDQKLIDTVTSAAVTKRDPKLLDFLDRKVPGQDYTWSNTPYGRDAKQKAIDSLETMGRRSIADDEKRRREEKTAEKDAVTRDTIQTITRSPNEPIPEALLARGEKVDPDFRINAIRWRDTIGKGTQTSDPQDILAVTTEVLNGGGMQAVQKAMARGVFKNASDLTTAYKLAEGMAKDGPAIDAMLKGGSAKSLLDTIKKRTANALDASKYFDDGSVSPEGLQAQTDFRLQVLAWRQAHPEAGPIEQEKAISDIGAGILGRIQQPAGPFTPVVYGREGLDGPNTFGAGAPAAAPSPAQTPAPAKTAPAQTPATGTPPAPAPQAVPSTTAKPEDAGTWYNGLPPETRAALEKRAAEEKKPLSLKVQEVYQKGVAVGIIKPVAPAQAPAVPAPQPGPAPETPAGKSPELRDLEQSYRRPGAKRPFGSILNPYGVFDNKPIAPWWPKKDDGEPKDEKFGMLAPDGTPIETASVQEPGAGRVEKAFQEAVDAPPAPDTVRLIGEAFQRALASTGKPRGGYTSAALQDDPKAARILDFVAGPESGGNYNAYYGHGGSTKDLSAMSLDQVMAWSGRRGTESSATGRYQFMQKTLAGLKREMGLTGTEAFTPALQDRMALQLLHRRGYGEWQAGRMTDAQFANRLALEWASLPNITAQNGRPAGVSAYAGDGLNKSLVRPGEVLSTLGRLIPRRLRPDDNRETRV